MILYDDQRTLDRFQRKYKIEYPLISDEGSVIINQFELLNKEMDPATRYFGVPYPGIFLIDHNGLVRGKFAEENYRVRPPWDDVMDATRALVAQ